MKAKYIFKGLLAMLLLAAAITGCESYNDPLLADIANNRGFSPVDVTAKIRNQTTVELDWMTRDEVDYYVVEFSADDTEFKTIFKTVEATADQLPIQVALEGETLYSIRVKAVTAGLADSKWTLTTANTLNEQLFLAVVNGDIRATQATLRWVAGSAVTQLTLTPGDIKHTITAEEKANGVATITGLTGETTYTANLYNGTKRRGSQIFETGLDIGDGVLISPTDDLSQKIAEAAPGAVLVLDVGDYTVGDSEIILNKPITIRGLRSFNKPKLHVKFTINAGTTDVSLIDLDFDGTGLKDAYFINLNEPSAAYGDFLISGSLVHDFPKALIYGNASASKVNSFTVDNSIITDVNTSGSADFIDFRNTFVANIVLKNSTFDTCSAGRDFLRVDAVKPANGFSGTGLTTLISIDSCTIYNSSNVTTGSLRKILYVRFEENKISVKNTLITETSAVYTNSSSTSNPTFTNNNYFNAHALKDSSILNNRPDDSATTLDPGFSDAVGGIFKISNQTLKDRKVGDSLWNN